MNVVVKDKKKGRREVTPSAPSIVLSSSQWGHMAKEAGSADRREDASECCCLAEGGWLESQACPGRHRQ